MRTQEEIELRLEHARKIAQHETEAVVLAPTTELIAFLLHWVLEDGTPHDKYVEQAWKAWEAGLIGDKKKQAAELSKLQAMRRDAREARIARN